MCGCYYGYLNVYMWMLRMFGCLCVDVYDIDNVKYDWKKKSLIAFCNFSDDTNNVFFSY